MPAPLLLEPLPLECPPPGPLGVWVVCLSAPLIAPPLWPLPSPPCLPLAPLPPPLPEPLPEPLVLVWLLLLLFLSRIDLSTKS